MNTKFQRRHGLSPAKAVREILSDAVRDEGGAQAPLGSRLAARFAGWGLTQDVPELRGDEARPADFKPYPRCLSEERRQRAIRKAALRNAAGRIEEAP